MNWQQIFEDNLKEIMDFVTQNEELVSTAINLTAISVLLSLNQFNDFERKVSTTISNYYRISYSPEKDFTADVINAGGLTFGQKVSILNDIMTKEHYKDDSKDPGKERSITIKPMKALGDIRNKIVHSTYRIDHTQLDENDRFIITIDGRQTNQKDFLKIIEDFKKKHSEALANLQSLAQYLQGKEDQDEK